MSDENFGLFWLMFFIVGTSLWFVLLSFGDYPLSGLTAVLAVLALGMMIAGLVKSVDFYFGQNTIQKFKDDWNTKEED